MCLAPKLWVWTTSFPAFFTLGLACHERSILLEPDVNVLAFGLPGTGKTHALCALGHRLVEAGHSVLFAPAYRLVQELLAAKRDLDLPQGAEESEVLFTLLGAPCFGSAFGFKNHYPRRREHFLIASQRRHTHPFGGLRFRYCLWMRRRR